MHALAIVLQQKGYIITGSDDEIYDPSLSRLRAVGLAPPSIGWDASRVEGVDAVVLGMHARVDNPELLAAQQAGLPIYSFPSFVAEVTADKTKVVITGSHGKTTTTAMIMHVLAYAGVEFDYLVGADIAGFDGMVKLTDAPLMLIEGDEYLSSPIDRRPKFIHFEPDVAVMTGIAWDHINVFETEEIYVEQFVALAASLPETTPLIYYAGDDKVSQIAKTRSNKVPYLALERDGDDHVRVDVRSYPVSVIGVHNLQNMHAALHVCHVLGIDTPLFFEAIKDFTGADRRLQVISSGPDRTVFYDFAHAPSKVRATTAAVKDWYPQRSLVACLELHTYSSLNRGFLPQYAGSLDGADHAVVFYNEHTLAIKKMPALSIADVKHFFGLPDLVVLTDPDQLYEHLRALAAERSTLLLMSSGRLQGMDIHSVWS